MPPKKKDPKAEEPQYVDEQGTFIHEEASARYAGGIRRFTVQVEASAKKGAATPPPTEGAAAPPAVLYRHGHGTYSCPTFEYSGEWVMDALHGKGELHFRQSGARYVGELVQGRYEGEGTYSWGDGAQYSGQWRAGRMHGEGTFTERGGSQVWRGMYYNGTGPGLERLHRAVLNPATS
ncbi:hypothetical protein AGDE_00179 [Angomonas deanei]|uniref:MORN repeat, putative n=1 Tax=Angomonas deanei TaxID=59799 RepID=S9WI19_9TRYP|nr:hypothetical protein AGDE_04978 [Angomonas deanei]EPY43742.1 hypothetical protein AGDE_00179 [Angomonas deanei]CAD2222913.1 MORN repeat, putative [Angomonas deanei]|eukprot:EPY38951.1 hypothetical protein AGDE_04978 [Angomonas deanei]